MLLALMLAACEPADAELLPTLVSIDELATQQAPSLIFWEAENGALRDAAQVDTYRFEAAAGDEIRVRVVVRGSGALTQTLLDASGNVLDSGTTIETTIPATGLYTVRVGNAGDEPVAYQIGLSYTDRENPTAQVTVPPQVVGIPTPTQSVFATNGSFISEIEANVEYSGTLDDEETAHLYTYDADAGQVIMLTLRRISGQIDPFLTLYAPDGQPLAMDDDALGGRNAQLVNILLPEAGQYGVQVGGGDRRGTYELTLVEGEQTLEVEMPTAEPTLEPTPYLTPTLLFAAQNSRLIDHQPQAGNLARAGDFMRFAFDVAAGDQITMRVEPFGSSGLRPAFEVFDPNGLQIASGSGRTSNAAGAAVVTGVAIETSGPHTAIVTGEDGTIGAFLIAYGRGMTALDRYQGMPESNTRLNATIGARGERHVWRVSLRAGDVITAAVNPGESALDPVVELANEDGVLIMSDDNSGGGRSALIRFARIERDGTYLIRVRDAASAAVGEYTMVWRYINRAPTPTPPAPSVPVLRINETVEDGRYEFFAFQGQAGQRVRIRVQAASGSDIDPVGTLLNPFGLEIASGDDSGGTLNADFEALLPETGTYTVRVNGYLSSGAFELLVDLLHDN